MSTLTTGSIRYTSNGIAFTKPKLISDNPNVPRGTNRGKISGWTWRSCKRLRETLLQCDYTKPCFGMAITFRAGTLPCQILKRHADVQRHVSRLPISAVVWRLEQTRIGTLHYHMIVWADDEMVARNAICRAYEMGGNYYVNASEKNVVRGLDNRKSICYLAAHQGKRKQYQIVSIDGVRHWGVMGRKNLPLYNFESLKIRDSSHFYRIMRSYKKFLCTNDIGYATIRFDDGRHMSVIKRLTEGY